MKKKYFLLSIIVLGAITVVALTYLLMRSRVENQSKAASVNSVLINSGAATTYSQDVQLTLTSAIIAKSMRIANSLAGVSTASAVPFTNIYSWKLAPGYGTKQVYVQYRNPNSPWTSVVADSILYAPQPTPTIMPPQISPTPINSTPYATVQLMSPRGDEVYSIGDTLKVIWNFAYGNQTDSRIMPFPEQTALILERMDMPYAHEVIQVSGIPTSPGYNSFDWLLPTTVSPGKYVVTVEVNTLYQVTDGFTYPKDNSPAWFSIGSSPITGGPTTTPAITTEPTTTPAITRVPTTTPAITIVPT